MFEVAQAGDGCMHTQLVAVTSELVRSSGESGYCLEGCYHNHTRPLLSIDYLVLLRSFSCPIHTLFYNELLYLLY